MRRLSRVLVATVAAWTAVGSAAYGADLLSTLTGSASSTSGATYTWQQINQMGKLNAHNGRLLPGCHMYPWTYSVHPPKGMSWEVDVYFIGPGGKQLAADGLMGGGDPLNGTQYYKLCSVTAPKGSYMINSTMTLWGDSGKPQVAHLPIVHYSLT